MYPLGWYFQVDSPHPDTLPRLTILLLKPEIIDRTKQPSLLHCRDIVTKFIHQSIKKRSNQTK